MKAIALLCAGALLVAGSHPAVAAPAVFLAPDALMCQGAGWLTEVTVRHRPPSEVAHDANRQCWLELSIPGTPLKRTRVVPLDADEIPFVFVCTSQHYSDPMAGVKIGFYCGETLAGWLVDERGSQLSLAQIRAIARTASMADVRLLPP